MYVHALNLSIQSGQNLSLGDFYLFADIQISSSLRSSKSWKILLRRLIIILIIILISLKEDKRYNLRSCAMGIMLQMPRTLTKKTLGEHNF